MADGWSIDLTVPFSQLPQEHRQILLFGIEQGMEAKDLRRGMGDVKLRYEGVCNTIKRRFHDTQSDGARRYYQMFMSTKPCSACNGARLRPEAHAVLIDGKSIVEMTAMTVAEMLATLHSIVLDPLEQEIATAPLREASNRLRFLNDVGLSYITIDRSADTLSGGEAQRIRLASQLGTELTGVIYVLDEPSIGLHPRDNQKLIDTLKSLRDMGNSVLVVEHDRETIEAADYIIDFGPGAGEEGGEVVFSGPAKEISGCTSSLTGQYLKGTRLLPDGLPRRAPTKTMVLAGACHNNLKNLDITFPLGILSVITGVSGAGKSSLVGGTLKPALNSIFGLATAVDPGRFDSLIGHEAIDKVVSIDQRPIGRTPRSNPSTYTKVFDLIRALFAETKVAKTYGYTPARFSFNLKGGRCEKCQGAGSLKVEMHFLPDVYVTCPECDGRRFNDATLRVKYKEKDISEVLQMPVNEAYEFFLTFTKISRILETLKDVGLGYIRLGQPSTTLSGGEAQRIKLSRELARRDTGQTLYLMDEPSTGLHFEDVSKLLSVIDKLVERGNTVLIVEHNLDIIRAADHVIDLGPDGGSNGGYLVAAGTPEEVADVEASLTGQYLKEALVTQ
jgi:excinuclease ABC subunit A